jgi:hypothetical protein
LRATGRPCPLQIPSSSAGPAGVHRKMALVLFPWVM